MKWLQVINCLVVENQYPINCMIMKGIIQVGCVWCSSQCVSNFSGPLEAPSLPVDSGCGGPPEASSQPVC